MGVFCGSNALKAFEEALETVNLILRLFLFLVFELDRSFC